MGVLVVLILVALLFNIVRASEVQNLTWEVEYKRRSPDGVEGVVMAINGMFPGPTIRARAGDTINLKLINKLHTEGVVIHWHGIRQYGTPWADGTASISQCAIDPGETYGYRFKVDKAGTYFYHGHFGMQRSAGLYGSLIVDVAEGDEKKILKYDEELPMILLSDWWHNSSRNQEVDLSSKPMTWVGEPQSLLINGRGRFTCSLTEVYSKPFVAGCSKVTTEDVLTVRPNQTYRLRIASSTALAALNFAIENHKITVVEADGNYVAPFTVDNLDIYSGESYSVIFTANQNPKNYWISVNVRGRKPLTRPALAILHYMNTNPPEPHAPLSTPPAGPRWDDYESSKAFLKKILAAPGSPPPPPQHHRRIMLLNTQNYIDGYTRWSINNISLSLPTTPYLGSVKYDITEAFDHQNPPPDTFDPNYDIMIPPTNKNTVSGNGVYTLEFNTTVDVILQNANTLTDKVSEIHPWHLHGHDFWVLGYGEGKFTEKQEASFNLKNPPLRNTAVIMPYGWTALRFVADNPGAWAFHCHIEPHLHLGMGVVFVEGVHVIKTMSIPNQDLACGLTAKFLMNDGYKRH